MPPGQRRYPPPMAHVHPFRALTFAAPKDQSPLIAPPYDVLDAGAKARLLAKDPRNVVAIDLPHTPAKALGPPAAYTGAAERLTALTADGTIARSAKPVMFAYRQTWTQPGATKPSSRSGMACTLDLVPFGPRPGGGVLPHEETFSGPKEDRLALMRATRTQLSPIFGLHADDHGRATTLLKRVMAAHAPDRTARTDDGTLHEVWTVDDEATVLEYQSALAGEDVFIADGHHRYTTALNYLTELEGVGPVGPDHLARRCMFVLVGMSDPGLTIWPTHRVLGGMRGYSFEAFVAAARDLLVIRPAPAGLDALELEMQSTTLPVPPLPRNVLGLYDFTTCRAYVATLAKGDPLATRFAEKPRAWRDLDVAIIQHAIVEELCQAKLNGGQPVRWAFPHTIEEVREIGSGRETGAGGGTAFGDTGAQLAIVVRPTPLQAVRDISRAGVLMPQKSTFFYPKLATGLFLNPLAEPRV